MPATLRGRVALGPAQLAVVAVLVALGLARHRLVGGPRRPRPARGAAAPVGGRAAAGARRRRVGAASPARPRRRADPARPVTVDVAGKVRRPGIAVLDAGARVVDALKAAGGARPGVDLASLNLARVLVDGEQVLVGVPAPPGVAAAAAAASPAAPRRPAGQPQHRRPRPSSRRCPRSGPVTAQAILAWRDEHGGFTAVDELLEVDGIGDATLAEIAPLRDGLTPVPPLDDGRAVRRPADAAAGRPRPGPARWPGAGRLVGWPALVAAVAVARVLLSAGAGTAGAAPLVGAACWSLAAVAAVDRAARRTQLRGAARSPSWPATRAVVTLTAR